MINRLASLCLVLTLAGCSSLKDNPIYGENAVIRDRSQEYAYAEPGKRLEIPGHLEPKATRDGLQVPEINSADFRFSQIQAEVPRPEFFFATEGSDRASIRPLKGERVILVDEPIDQVWTDVLGYWQDAGVGLDSRDARAGTMETEWIRVEGEDLTPFQRVLNTLQFNAEANEPSINKLRLTLRPDSEDTERTAISLQQLQYPLSEQPMTLDWEGEGEGLAYTNEILFSMLSYLSRSDRAGAPQTLSAFQEDQGLVAEMGQDSRNRPLLSITAPVDRSWALVNEALDKAGIDVGTRNEGRGVFYLTYYAFNQEPEYDGFFDWLLNRDTSPIRLNFTVDNDLQEEEGEVLYSSDPDAVVAGAKPTQEQLQAMEGFKIWLGGRIIYVFGNDNQNLRNEDGETVLVKRYQLKFNRARTGVLVSVHDQQGEPVIEDAAEELLWTIKDNLAI